MSMTDQSKPILIMDDKTRANLKASLDALAEAEDAINDMMAPQRKALGGIHEARAALLERYGFEEIAGECGACEMPIFCGEQGYNGYEDGPMFCATHAPSWGDLKSGWDEQTQVAGFWDGEATEDDDGDCRRAHLFQQSYDAHIAGGGSPDDKVLYTL